MKCLTGISIEIPLIYIYINFNVIFLVITLIIAPKINRNISIEIQSIHLDIFKSAHYEDLQESSQLRYFTESVQNVNPKLQ